MPGCTLESQAFEKKGSHREAGDRVKPPGRASLSYPRGTWHPAPSRHDGASGPDTVWLPARASPAAASGHTVPGAGQGTARRPATPADGGAPREPARVQAGTAVSRPCSLKQLLPQPPFSSLHKLPARSLLPTTSVLTQGALPPCRRRKGVRGPVGCARAPCSDLPCQAPGGAQGTAPNPPGSHGTPPSRHTHPNASHQLLQQAPATGHAEVYQSPEP